MFLGSACVKAAHKMLMKLIPDENLSNVGQNPEGLRGRCKGRDSILPRLDDLVKTGIVKRRVNQ